MNEAIGLIKDIGFPIFVALYLLLRFENVLRALTKSNTALREAIQKLCDKQG